MLGIYIFVKVSLKKSVAHHMLLTQTGWEIHWNCSFYAVFVLLIANNFLMRYLKNGVQVVWGCPYSISLNAKAHQLGPRKW